MSSSCLRDDLDLDAVILAGGLGSRLRPIVPDCQKVATLVNGEPFLVHILRHLKVSGIRRVILALGYKADSVMAAIYPFLPPDMIIVPSLEHTTLGTGGALRHTLSLIKTPDVFIMNGDSFIDYSFVDFFSFHRRHKASASMLLCEVPDVSRYGTVVLDQKERVIRFYEKRPGSCCPGTVNAGVYLMSRKLIATFPKTHHSLERTTLPSLCGDGLYGLVTRAPFIDIGTPDDYSRVSRFLSKSLSRKFC